MSDTLCSLPWMHLFVDGMGHFYNCCYGTSAMNPSKDLDGKVILASEENSIKKHWNSLFMQGIRQSMHENKKHQSCEGCWRVEETGSRSFRIDTKEEYPVDPEIQMNLKLDPVIRYVDLRFGNLCNLACRMCIPYNSRKLFKEFEAMYGPGANDDYKKMDWFESLSFWSQLFSYKDHFEKIHLAGGEPLLIKNCWDFLKKISEEKCAKNIHLSYNTNLTKIPKEAEELWPKFKGVVLIVSMDGIGKTNEFIRYPQKWSEIESNLWEIENNFQKYNIHVCQIQPTIQAYNIHRIVEICDFLAQFKMIKRIPHMNLLFYPPHFSPSILPVSYRQEAVDKLEKYIEKVLSGHNSYDDRDKSELISSLRGVISYIMTGDTPELRHDFIRHNDIYDVHRNQKILEYIPELEVLYQK